MTWLSETVPLIPDEAIKLPDGPAVYVLWHGMQPVYAGYVDRHTQPLGLRILGHCNADGEDTPTGATHFSYEITNRPLSRLQVVKATLDERNLKQPQFAAAEEAGEPDTFHTDPTLPPFQHDGLRAQ